MDINLSGKTAIVCGATQGIGKATANALAHLGANIILIARNEDSLALTLKELPTDQSQKHTFFRADFSDIIFLKNHLPDFLKSYDKIHILVNNTGGPKGGQAIDADISEFESAFGQHLLCSQILAQNVVPLMKNAQYGRIINVISTSVKQPIVGLGVSNTIRAAMANWSKTLSMELGIYGITVNNILPGSTETQRIKAIIADRAQKSGKSEAEIREMMEQEIPLRRFAKPEETANAIAFLASPAAAYISGINLPVDGGKTGCL